MLATVFGTYQIKMSQVLLFPAAAIKNLAGQKVNFQKKENGM